MKLIGRAWNSLDGADRMILLRQCDPILSESLMQHESTLAWDELWPMRQDNLGQLNFSAILGRDLAP